MDIIDTKKDNSGSDAVDPSTQFVTIAMVKEVSNSTAPLRDEPVHQDGDNEAPIQYRLYKRRWLGIVALVRAPLRTRDPLTERTHGLLIGYSEYCQGNELGMVRCYCQPYCERIRFHSRPNKLVRECPTPFIPPILVVCSALGP